MRPFGLAYLPIVDPVSAETDATHAFAGGRRGLFGGALVVNGCSRETADAAIARAHADAVSFGVPFLANPDLPWRLAIGAPLNVPDPATFYTGGDAGYVDYPALGEAA